VKRVLVWDTELLMAKGVEFILASETSLEVIGIESKEEADLLNAVERYQPDAVVLCDSDRLLKENSVLMKLLTGFPNLWVIMVSSEDNRIKLYNKRELLLTQASDLSNIISSNQIPVINEKE